MRSQAGFGLMQRAVFWSPLMHKNKTHNVWFPHNLPPQSQTCFFTSELIHIFHHSCCFFRLVHSLLLRLQTSDCSAQVCMVCTPFSAEPKLQRWWTEWDTFYILVTISEYRALPKMVRPYSTSICFASDLWDPGHFHAEGSVCPRYDGIQSEPWP